MKRMSGIPRKRKPRRRRRRENTNSRKRRRSPVKNGNDDDGNNPKKRRKIVPRTSPTAAYRVPGRIKKYFGVNKHSCDDYLAKIINFIEICQINFKNTTNGCELCMDFTDICLYPYEINLIENFFIKRIKIQSADRYIALMHALNFPQTHILDEVVINHSLKNTTEEEVKTDDKKLTRFTDSACRAMRNSLDFLNEKKKLSELRLRCIRHFDSNIIAFLGSGDGWKLSTQIFKMIKILKMNKWDKEIRGSMMKTTNYLRGLTKNNVIKMNPRIIRPLEILCRILVKCSNNGIWNVINKNTNNKLTEFIEMYDLGAQKNLKFIDNIVIDVHNDDHVTEIGIDGNTNMRLCKFKNIYLTFLFNRWSYAKFRHHGDGRVIKTGFIFKEFANFIQSLKLENTRFVTKVDQKSDGSERKFIRRNMYFFKPTKNYGRTFIFMLNGIENNKNVKYELE